MPRKKKTKKKILSDDPRITDIRKKTEKVFCRYTNHPTELNREELQECKKELQNTYDVTEEEELDKMIKEVEDTNAKSKHRESLNLINKITGRKTAKQSIIKAKNEEERIQKWYNHFKKLLGNEATVEGDLDNEMEPVLQNLGIKDCPFSAEEYKIVKKAMMEGKGSGPDLIPPEVFKRCDLDDILC